MTSKEIVRQLDTIILQTLNQGDNDRSALLFCLRGVRTLACNVATRGVSEDE